MRLPIQPKIVKPKVNTIANTIQNRFMLVLSLGCDTPGSGPSIPVRRCRHPHGPLHASPACLRLPSSSPLLPRANYQECVGSIFLPRIGLIYIRRSSPHHPESP